MIALLLKDSRVNKQRQKKTHHEKRLKTAMTGCWTKF